MRQPPDLKACKGQWEQIVARDPQSVCCDESLMVCALRTVGVRLHPAFGFLSYLEDVDGQPVKFWRWVVSAKSSDGLYSTADLMKWWNNPAWLKANPKHEFTAVVASLKNMGVHAADVRAAIPRIVLHRGNREVQIPVNASPEKRAFLVDKLEGRIPKDAKFEQPASA